MPELIAESYINQLKQYLEQKPAREPSVNRGHRLRNINGGQVNRLIPLDKMQRGVFKTSALRSDGQRPDKDNPRSNPPNPKTNIGLSQSEYSVDQRYNLGAFNNVSVIRDFASVGPDFNADVMGSSSSANPSYATGGTSLKPTLYDIYIGRGLAAGVPNLITYAGLGLRVFNPALPVTIVGTVEDHAATTGRIVPAPVGCPAFPASPMYILEFNLIENGYGGVTYDTGFYYRAILHDYFTPAFADMTCLLAVHIHVIGYEGP